MENSLQHPSHLQMPISWTWQTLRDKFRDVGEVKFAEIRGQDTGVVRFAKERDAEVAISMSFERPSSHRRPP